MARLILHKTEVATVFNLLGTKENDLSYSLGWALAQCPPFLGATVRQFTGQVIRAEEFDHAEVKLQTYGKQDGGFTDVEIIIPDRCHLIIEMKRGWVVPGLAQLTRYTPRFKEEKQPLRRLFTLSECSREYAEMLCPAARFKAAKLVHLAWTDLYTAMSNARAACDHRQKRLLDEFKHYLMNTVSQRKLDTNWVYVVALNDTRMDGWDISFHDVAIHKGKYFHPVGHGYPKDPPTYIAFRYKGQLLSIHYIKSYSVTRNARKMFGQKAGAPFDTDHFVYELGPAIIPKETVRTGKGIFRSGRVWCLLDTLLSYPTITEALAATKKREKEFAGVPKQ